MFSLRKTQRFFHHGLRVMRQQKAFQLGSIFIPCSRYFSSGQLSKAEKQLLEENKPQNIRNVAIIAHVDHGKTTLVDCLLRQSGISFSQQRAMDSNALEQERGITILSKCTSVTFGGHKINIVDTPGHSDFGGEVERIMSMVDAVCLVVCATEGPMPQTKFVLRKALEQNLRPIIVINKVDRDTARVDEVQNQIFDLFCELDATDQQLQYPVIYASAKDGWAINDLKKERNSVQDLLNIVIQHTPPPQVQQEEQKELVMLVSQTESNPIFGKTLIGRIQSGSIGVGDKVNSISDQKKVVEQGRIIKVLKRYGMQNIQLQRAYAGDIVSIAGMTTSTVTNTLNTEGNFISVPSIPIDPPLISMNIIPNNSPLNGNEGDKHTVLQIRERLYKEAENDVSLKVEPNPLKKDEIKLMGRGDLHLGVLVEKMRREGFELAISPPQVVVKQIKGKLLEPIERFTIECDVEYMNTLIERMMPRKGELETTEDISAERVKLTFTVPARGLIGLRQKVIQETKGNAIIQTEFIDYMEHRGPLERTQKGAIISTALGTTTAYGLRDVEVKGSLFIGPGVSVYEGMVIGEHTLESDIDMNPCKAKKLTNIRSAGNDENIRLQPPRRMTLEDAVAYIRNDELLEVTPKNIRIRKVILDQKARLKAKRELKNQAR